MVCEKRGRGGEKEFKKEGETSREERPMILTPKRQTLSKKQIDRILYVNLTSSFLVQFVQRITYKLRN